MPTAKAPAKKTTKKPAAKKPAVKKAVAHKAPAHKVATHKPTVVHAAPKPIHEQLGPREKYHFAVGKRKSAIARVRYYELGTGEMVVNGKTPEQYFAFASWSEQAKAPLTLTGWAKGRWSVKTHGGGTHGQAHATSHGIARVLLQLDPALRPALKAAGMLTRDARVKERKKYGLKRARRAPQWQKR